MIIYIITFTKKRRKKPLFTLWEFTFSSFEETWIPFIQEWFVLRLVEIGSFGSGGEDFKISSMYFHYFVIISPWKRAGPFIWTNLNHLHPRMLCAKFGWNWPSVSGEEDENVQSLRRQQRQQRQRTTKIFWSEKLRWAKKWVSCAYNTERLESPSWKSLPLVENPYRKNL